MAAQRQAIPTPPQEAYQQVHDSAALFVERLLRRHLWSKQREVLEAISTHERVAVASCHSVGKSFLAAGTKHWFSFTRRPSVVITTAPTWNQVENVIWRYSRREFTRLPKYLQDCATMLNTRLDFGPDHYAFGLSTDKPDNFQGFHSPHIMVIVDEAAGVDDRIFEAAATFGAGGEYRELLIGNPTSASGKFHRAFHNPELGYHCIRIDALETPNFTGEDCPAALLRELIHPEQVAKWAADWGEESPAYLSRVHALFPDAGEEAVIAPLAWFDAAKSRTGPAQGADFVQLGVDVARFGTDRSSICVRAGNELLWAKSYQGQDTRDFAIIVRDVAALWAKKLTLPVVVCIDETGVGAGVVDNCRPHNSQQITYLGVNFGSAARDAGKFANLRAEMYWHLRELLRMGNNEPNLLVTATGPEVERLGSQLAAIRYEYSATEKVKVERKEEMRERKMPSPDEADAAVLAFFPPRGNVGGTGMIVPGRGAQRRF